MSSAIVILAAGQGTRMKSDLPKVLHPVGGCPMIVRAVQMAEQLKAEPIVIVVGHGSQNVQRAVDALGIPAVQYAVQAQQLGTGHAVLQAADVLRGKVDTVIVCYADMPLLRAETVSRLTAVQAGSVGPLSLLTVTLPEPRGFGRIVRDISGHVAAIVEEHEATAQQREIRELNAGVYAFRADWLWATLPTIAPKSKGEIYLTDLIEVAVAQGHPVIGLEAEDPDEIIGVNNRVHLAEAESALRRRINRHWMLHGVTLLDPATTYIHEAAHIGQDTVILPNTHILGKSAIGAGCTIGPNSVIVESRIGNHCRVEASVIEEAHVGDHSDVGPFSHLRKNTYLADHVHIGNFGEVKNSRLGAYTRMGHFSYIGDAEIGDDVNIGAGTITVNFDGVKKNKTTIGDHAFIGSDSMLIAPLNIADNARTAAGSVVTKDVPSGHIAIGVPARMRKIRPPEPPSEGS